MQYDWLIHMTSWSSIIKLIIALNESSPGVLWKYIVFTVNWDIYFKRQMNFLTSKSNIAYYLQSTSPTKNGGGVKMLTQDFIFIFYIERIFFKKFVLYKK